MANALILPLALALVGATASAQDLSLKDAARMALAQNQSIKASEAAEEAAASRVDQARSGRLPKIDYAESWAGSDNPVFVFSSLLTEHQFGEQNFQIGPLNRPDFLNNFQSQLTLDQPLYDAGKTKRAVHSAELARNITGQDVRRTQLDVIASVVRAYTDAQLGASQLNSALQAIRSVQADLARAQSRLEAGMATDADVLSIRVHLAGVEEERIRRETDLDVARAALNDALGLPLDTPHTLTTALRPLTLGNLTVSTYEQNAATGRPEVIEVNTAKQQADTALAEARGNLLPEVNFHSAFEADRQRFYDRGGDNWLLSIDLRWNLFNGFADKARIKENESAQRRAAAEQERTNSAIRLQVRRAWAELNAAQKRIDSARAAQAEAEESLRISQNRYEAGLSTVTDLLRVEAALLETRTRYQAAVHDQRIAAAALELATGTLTASSEVLN